MERENGVLKIAGCCCCYLKKERGILLNIEHHDHPASFVGYPPSNTLLPSVVRLRYTKDIGMGWDRTKDPYQAV